MQDLEYELAKEKAKQYEPVSDICPECKGKLTHCTVWNFQYCWWQCDGCGWMSKDIPQAVLDLHKETFTGGMTAKIWRKREENRPINNK